MFIISRLCFPKWRHWCPGVVWVSQWPVVVAVWSDDLNEVATTGWEFYSQPAHDTATNMEWQLPEAVLIQFVSPDDEHDMLETSREL